MRRGKLLFTIKEIQEPIYDAFDEFTGNYKKAYSNFNKLKQEQASKNPEGLWETDQKPEDPWPPERLNTKAYPNILMMRATGGAYYFPDIDVYEYGNNGFEFISHHQPVTKQDIPLTTTLKALPACKEGFHRAWDQDGICVKTIYQINDNDIPDDEY